MPIVASEWRRYRDGYTDERWERRDKARPEVRLAVVKRLSPALCGCWVWPEGEPAGATLDSWNSYAMAPSRDECQEAADARLKLFDVRLSEVQEYILTRLEALPWTIQLQLDGSWRLVRPDLYGCNVVYVYRSGELYCWQGKERNGRNKDLLSALIAADEHASRREYKLHPNLPGHGREEAMAQIMLRDWEALACQRTG